MAKVAELSEDGINIEETCLVCPCTINTIYIKKHKSKFLPFLRKEDETHVNPINIYLIPTTNKKLCGGTMATDGNGVIRTSKRECKDGIVLKSNESPNEMSWYNQEPEAPDYYHQQSVYPETSSSVNDYMRMYSQDDGHLFNPDYQWDYSSD